VEELKELVTRARAGDREAFGEIVRRFQDMAQGCAYAYLGDFHLAEDAAQEAFLDVYRQLPALRHPEAFTGWFRRIIFKHCDRITREKRLPTVAIDNVDAAAPDGEDEMKETVLEAIHALPEHERLTTTLFYINGYSQKEIGEFLEVPVTTVKKRLYDARKKLKEGMMDMVKTTLKENALPEDFARRLLRFPFPRRQPEVMVKDLSGEGLEIECGDAQIYFVPLAEGGKCDWAFYDRPEGRLTGVYESHVIDTAKWGRGNLLRIWTRYTDFEEKDKEEWKEEHFLVEDKTYRRVKLEAGKPDTAKGVRLATYAWADGEESRPEPMRLKAGLKWGDPASEVAGACEVTIAGHDWKCLKVTGTSPDLKTYCEWYAAESGRTVLFRRYNGPGWRKPEEPGSFELLAGEHEVAYRGGKYRHWYDCIPDIGLTSCYSKNPL
jgi:RNA polymerase sigma factor (sigma-70 family)